MNIEAKSIQNKIAAGFTRAGVELKMNLPTSLKDIALVKAAEVDPELVQRTDSDLRGRLLGPGSFFLRQLFGAFSYGQKSSTSNPF